MQHNHNRPKVQIGAVPGDLVKHDFATASRVRLIEYDPSQHSDQMLESPAGLSSLSHRGQSLRIRPRRSPPRSAGANEAIAGEAVESVKPEKPVTWINIDGLANIDLLHALGETYRLHALALEDVVNVHQHAKTEAYENNIFMVIRMPRSGDRFSTEQVSLFLLDGVVITLQEYQGDCLNPVRARLATGKGRIRSRGADYLAYAIIDAVIDGYFPVLERYDARLAEIAEEIDDSPPHDIPKRLHDVRADLLNLRKVAQQHRVAVTDLLREQTSVIREETHLFLRDCLDHIGRLIEAADTYRETCGELRELYFAQLGQKTNDVMKVLTIVATVFIPMSFVAGVYGMNFDQQVSPFNMPELQWAFGYPFALLLMSATGGGLLFYLRRKGWL